MGQCLTSDRVETSNKRKKICGQIGAEMIFSILILSNFHSDLLVFSEAIIYLLLYNLHDCFFKNLCLIFKVKLDSHQKKIPATRRVFTIYGNHSWRKTHIPFDEMRCSEFGFFRVIWVALCLHLNISFVFVIYISYTNCKHLLKTQTQKSK